MVLLASVVTARFWCGCARVRGEPKTAVDGSKRGRPYSARCAQHLASTDCQRSHASLFSRHRASKGHVPHGYAAELAPAGTFQKADARVCGACPPGALPECHHLHNTSSKAAWRRPLAASHKQRAGRCTDWLTSHRRRHLSNGCS